MIKRLLSFVLGRHLTSSYDHNYDTSLLGDAGPLDLTPKPRVDNWSICEGHVCFIYEMLHGVSYTHKCLVVCYRHSTKVLVVSIPGTTTLYELDTRNCYLVAYIGG